jgi:hypothetical protein
MTKLGPASGIYNQRFIEIFLQLRGPDIALSSKILHDLTTVRHFKSFFCYAL